MADLDDAAKDLFGDTMKRQTDRTDEALRHIIAFLVGQNFEIWEMGGKIVKCHLKRFGDVKEGKAGLDVVFDDGGHLELQVTRTGWGSPTKAMSTTEKGS